MLGLLQAASDGKVTAASGALIVIGSALLGLTTGLFGRSAWRVAWPVALVAVGVWLLAGWGRRHPDEQMGDEATGLAVFSTSTVISSAAAFRRGALTAVFGSVALDLSSATLQRDGARVSATSVFGSVHLIVPQGWRVQVRGVPLFGGWDDTTARTDVAGAPRLDVQALVVFGGLEVRHPQRWV